MSSPHQTPDELSALENALLSEQDPERLRTLALDAFRRMVEFRAWAAAHGMDLRVDPDGGVTDRATGETEPLRQSPPCPQNRGCAAP